MVLCNTYDILYIIFAEINATPARALSFADIPPCSPFPMGKREQSGFWEHLRVPGALCAWLEASAPSRAGGNKRK